ncbi:MAG: A/G-specific adenine glycosylase [Promethearchaeota archaeon]
MTRTEIASFQRILRRWYVKNRRDLPWRNTTDPYAIWVSEVMLQQTQVNTVLSYYNSFLKRFPTVRDLAGADLQEVLKSWEGMGYYGRARNFHKAAEIVTQQHKGIIPDRWEDFRGLPGVGDYIAAAVLSMAFQQPYPVMDGNVKRVLSRLLLLEDPANQSLSANKFREAAAQFLDRRPGQKPKKQCLLLLDVPYIFIVYDDILIPIVFI